MTTSLRRSSHLVRGLLAALALAAAACAQPGPAAGGTPPSASPAAPAVRQLTTCFGAPPAGWAGTRRASMPTTQFFVSAVTPSGDRAYGLSRTSPAEQGIAAMDLATGALTHIVALPAGSSGLSSLAVAPPWLAWVQGGSPTNPGDWSILARNLDTGEQLTLATPRLADGSDGFGHVPDVAVAGGAVVWAQSTSRSGDAAGYEVRAYDLAARRQTVLDSGAVGSPVLAGRYLVWSHAADDGTTTLRAVDASTRQPADLPAAVRSQPAITSLAGAPGSLVWSTDGQHAFAWRVDRNRLATYTTDGSRHRLQFLTVAGHS
jgi:hypothetical protein